MTVLRLVLVALAVLSQAREPFNQRPADATVVISATRAKYDGTYAGSLVARTCGELPATMTATGVPSFMVMFFPDDGVGAVRDISFNSAELVGKVTAATKFSLSVGVHSPKIGSRTYLLDTARPKMSGTATLTSPTPGTVQLKVMGTNDLGEKVDLTVVCKPRA